MQELKSQKRTNKAKSIRMAKTIRLKGEFKQAVPENELRNMKKKSDKRKPKMEPFSKKQRI